MAQTRTEPPFAPKGYDHRFDHPGWQKAPFKMWQQGFLAVQDWWDYATDPLRGLRPEDADRTRFMMRQMLDTVSPSNFPGPEPRDHRGNGQDRRQEPERRGRAFLARLSQNAGAGA